MLSMARYVPMYYTPEVLRKSNRMAEDETGKGLRLYQDADKRLQVDVSLVHRLEASYSATTQPSGLSSSGCCGHASGLFLHTGDDIKSTRVKSIVLTAMS